MIVAIFLPAPGPVRDWPGWIQNSSGPEKDRHRLQGNDMNTLCLCTARGALALLALVVTCLLFAGAYLLEGHAGAPRGHAP
jgi:hypothetical protein